MNYELALRSLLQWASHNDNIRAVVLTGSAAAASDHLLSDRDIELHVRDSRPLEIDDSWWTDLGTVLAVERLENGDDQPTRLIYYVGGKLDFTLVGAGEGHGEYERPFKVLLDKDNVAKGFSMRPRQPPIPDQKLFDECCNWA